MGLEPSVGSVDEHGIADGATAARRLSASSRYAQLPRPTPGVPDGPRPGTAPALAVAGGALLAAATAGAWVRETVVADIGAQPEVVVETLGWQVTGGPVLAVLGLLLACSGPWWLRAGRQVRRVLIGSSALVAVAVLVALVRVQGTVDAGVATAIEAADVAARHVGVGWGVWAATTAAAACALAAVTAWAAPTQTEEDA